MPRRRPGGVAPGLQGERDRQLIFLCFAGCHRDAVIGALQARGLMRPPILPTNESGPARPTSRATRISALHSRTNIYAQIHLISALFKMR